MSSVQMTRSDSILDVVEQMKQRIAARAYDMFKSRGVAWGDAWEDWFAAEREVIRKPAVELSEENGSYTVLASLAGMEPKRLHVSIAPQDLAITAEDAHTHTAKERQVHECDFRAGSVFRSIHFPRPVDLNRATAEFHDGMLTVKAPIVTEAASKRLDVRVA
jgi:HSP20 family molecular chaperone IbpA